MMKKVLILSHENDPHAKFICNYFDEQKVKYFRLNIDRLIGNYEITFNSSSNKFSIFDKSELIVLDKSWNIWNRRLVSPKIPNEIPKNLHDIIYKETAKTLEGLLFIHEGQVINREESNHNASNKIDQLKFVNNYGMKIPDTTLTNYPQKLIDFYNNHKKICHKLQKQTLVKKNKGKTYGVLNNIVGKENIKHAELIKNYPALFQEYIDKKYELRITALKSKIIPIAIYSQNSPISKIDFRRYDFENIKYAKVNIPNKVEQFCFDILKHYKLDFAEIDMILDDKNNYVFLELNANGQWLWLEQMSGYNLTKDVAENLL